MIIDSLLTIRQDLTATHLGIAGDSLRESRRQAGAARQPPWAWILSRRSALTSIIHAYSALESAVNGIGYEFFCDKESPHYICKRDAALRRLIDAWNHTLPIRDKFAFILEHGNTSAEPRLTYELQELNNLRNWLLHGFSYKTTLLLEKLADKDHYLRIDREDTCDWQAKFPNTKFNALDEIEYQDAVTANRIVLNSLVLLSRAVGTIYFVQTYEGSKPEAFMISAREDTPPVNIDLILGLAAAKGVAPRKP